MNQSYVMCTCASRTVLFHLYATAIDCMMKDLQNVGHDFDSHWQDVHQTQRKQNISHSFLHVHAFKGTHFTKQVTQFWHDEYGTCHILYTLYTLSPQDTSDRA